MGNQETIRIGDTEIKPFVIRGYQVLNTREAARFLDMSEGGLVKKAQRQGLRRLRSPLRETQTFYPLVQLQALKAGEKIPAIDIPEEEEEEAGEEQSVKRVAPALVDGVVCVDERQAAYYMDLSPNTFHKNASQRGVKSLQKESETYYPLAQLIAWKRREPNLPTVPEWA